MNRRTFLSTGVGGLAFAASGCAIDPKFAYEAAPVSAEEHAQTISAMKPPKRARPVVAVLCENMGSETTDAIIPWSVLTRSGVADVIMVSTEAGPVTLHPALKINAAKTTAEFEATWPDGPDYVIVPAYHDPKAPKAIEWMQLMSRRGSTIVSVCAGGLTVGHAGLFEGRQATTHWFSVDELKKISPGMIWRKDRRYVADRGVVSTTGVSASIPVSLALVEAIAGRSKADALAVELGVSKFDEAHDSNAFRKADGFLGRGVVNSANLLGQETYALRISDGVDELTLAVTADAWSRTYRSTCLTIGSAATVRSLHGLDLIVDRGSEDKHLHALEALPAKPGEGINSALAAVAKRYGVPTASFVALQLEYPWLAGKAV